MVTVRILTSIGSYEHHHLDFHRGDGRAGFRDAVNRVLARNQLAYELDELGRIGRLAPPILREALVVAVIETGDVKLDGLLEVAREKFLDPDPRTRRHGLDKLWDAFERLKTLEPGDKKAAMTSLIEKAAPEPNFRKIIETEALSLTQVGNTFHIRHSERSQTDLESELAIDYLFHRLFALVWFLLKSRSE